MPAPRTEIDRSIFWQQTERVDLQPGLAGDATTDVCFIGGGYTSLWTAIFLKQAEPSIDIRIVEADYVGAGASGHNDGFLTATIGHSLSVVVSQFGVDEARNAYAALGRSIRELLRFCTRHGIDAEIEANGFYLVATSDGQMRRLEQDVELASQFGGRQQLVLLDREAMRERLPSPVVQGGIHGGGALINTFKLVQGLKRVALDLGVVIHEQTRATEVVSNRAQQQVVTPRGTITGEHVVFATDAFQHQFPEFRRHVLPVWSYALVSEPLTDEQLDRVRWTTRQGFVEAKNFIVFGRLTAENRILMGGGPAPYYFGRSMSEPRHLRNDRIEALLRAEVLRFLPQLHDLRWSHFYGGPIAMTRKLVPQVGTLRGGWHFAHGYCGNGISSTHLAGKALRDLIMGKDTKYANLFFVAPEQPRLPPEPLAYAAAKAATVVLGTQDRRPDLVRWPRL